MGTLFVVATPIGNLKDITQRALEVLKESDLILCEDTRTSLKLLKHYDINKQLISYHKFNEKDISDKIIAKLKDDKNIALISDAGTPCISDPGYILVKKAKEENIEVKPVGGISAFVSALSASGLKTDSFTFYGFFPRENKQRTKLVKEINDSKVTTYIFYESPKRIIKTLEYIKERVNNPTVSVFKEITKIHERNYYGTLEKVLEDLKKDENAEKGEYTFILEKENIEVKQESLSIEALLVEEMINNKISLKEAIDTLNKKFDTLNKKDIYNASLSLKDIFKK